MNFPFSAPRLALVRSVPDTFCESLRETPLPINISKARTQHDGYVQALHNAGLNVIRLSATHHLPDSCFIEDPIVVVEDRALITRSAVATRQPERPQIAKSIQRWCQVTRMTHGTLDGGDVLRIGPRVYIGCSQRTNSEGIAEIKRFAAVAGLSIHTIPLQYGLHLKSLVTVISANEIVIDPRLDPNVFEDVTPIVALEPTGANVLALGNHILVSSAATQTGLRLEQHGFNISLVDVSEFHKADGALTCLSVRLPHPNTWCA